ncbi:hypothetical protein BHE74_00015163 [Ensete ventricosum]|nr:hypothetical protein BHE74_00015163 [Ensete ventricosum]
MWLSSSSQIPEADSGASGRAVLEVGGELQRRVQDGDVERGDGGGGDDHPAVPDAAVPLHPPCRPLCHHHGRDARPGRLRGGDPFVARRQGRLLRLPRGVPRRRLRQRRDRTRHRSTLYIFMTPTCMRSIANSSQPLLPWMQVSISILRVLLFVSRPRTTVLGKVPNSAAYRRVDQYPVAQTVPGVLILRIDAPIYFTNASYLRERISRWIDEENGSSKGETSLQYLILDMGAVGSIDTSGISMLDEVKKIVDRRSIKVGSFCRSSLLLQHQGRKLLLIR